MQHTRFALLFNRLKRRFFSRTHLARVVSLGLGLFLLALTFFFLTKAIEEINQFKSKNIEQSNGQTNILILGVGGQNHDGPDLTDTIIVASFSHVSQKITLLSVPRDIWIPTLNAKINSVYHYGETVQTGGGLLLTKSAISQIIDQPIHYAIMIDFSLFQKSIDLLDGIDVTVDFGFTDNDYPIAGKENDTCGNDPQARCRYETITFAPGLQHMDGTTALKFVRSRHAQGDQGTDFARSQRQEKVIAAFKQKLLSLSVTSHPKLYYQLYEQITQSIHTDFPRDMYPKAMFFGLKSRSWPIHSYTLSTPDQLSHPPISPEYLNQWVLIPKDNRPENITNYVKNIFTSPDTQSH